jgi:hypothetical protein
MARRPMPADLFTPGQVVTVTNHYITHENHPCFGTKRRTIERVNGSSIYFTETGRVAWPKASQVWVDGPVVELRGGGCGQQPTDLFLTIVREGK